MKQIQLVNHKIFCLVDDEDYEILNRFSWYLIERTDGCYAYTKIDGNTVYMHQFVLPSNDPKLTPDHKNGNGLDNQKINLRLATPSQQGANRGKQSNGKSSQYKGVCWDKENRKWIVHIKVDKKMIHLGRFKSEKRAAVIYNEAAVKHFGEFAKLNTIEVIQ